MRHSRTQKLEQRLRRIPKPADARLTVADGRINRDAGKRVHAGIVADCPMKRGAKLIFTRSIGDNSAAL